MPVPSGMLKTEIDGADRDETDDPDRADRVQDLAGAEPGDERRRDRYADNRGDNRDELHCALAGRSLARPARSFRRLKRGAAAGAENA